MPDPEGLDLQRDFCLATRRKLRIAQTWIRQQGLEDDQQIKLSRNAVLEILKLRGQDERNELISRAQGENSLEKLERLEEEEKLLIEHLSRAYLDRMLEKREAQRAKRWARRGGRV